MKQLTYTSCITGRSVSGSSGFQVRAATPGLSAQQLWLVTAYAGYKLPEGVTPCDEAVATAPVRLALLDTPNLGRILLHGVYAGREGGGMRQGNFFTHMLLLVSPTDVDAGQAIRTWGSPFWKTHDDDSPAELPEVKSVPQGQGPELDAARLANVRGMLSFLLNALMLPATRDKRIILAAPASEVALCLAAAARVFPDWFLRGLTFSTYEPTPLSCAARVVGTCWATGGDGGADAARDLPSGCYDGACVAYNHFDGRHSELPGESLYAGLMLNKLMASKESEIDRFLGRLKNWVVDELELLELATHVAADKCHDLTAEQIGRLLAHRDLGPEVVRKPSGLSRIVALSKRDASFFRSAFPLALGVLEDLEVHPPYAQQLDHASQNWLEDWLAQRQYLRQPDYSNKIPELTRLIGKVPAGARDEASAKLLDAVFRALLTLTKPKTLQGPVEYAMRQLEAITPEGQAGVYRALWGHSLATSDACGYRLVLALIAVGIGKSDGPVEVPDEIANDLKQSLKKLRKKPDLRENVRREILEWAKKDRGRLPRWLGRTWREWLLVRGLPVILCLLLLIIGAAWILTTKQGKQWKDTALQWINSALSR